MLLAERIDQPSDHVEGRLHFVGYPGTWTFSFGNRWLPFWLRRSSWHANDWPPRSIIRLLLSSLFQQQLPGVFTGLLGLVQSLTQHSVTFVVGDVAQRTQAARDVQVFGELPGFK